MISAYAYLILGVLLVGSSLVWALYRGAFEWPDRWDLVAVLVAVFIIGIVGIAVLLWPALLVLIVSGWLKRKDDTPVEEQFTVPEAGLIAQLSVAEIEHRELVDDPLGGAPRLPFGHLNPVWRKLLESAAPESTLWSFSTLWDHRWGAQQVEGYVLKSGAVIGPHMITSQRRRPREPAEEPTSPKIGLIEALSGRR